MPQNTVYYWDGIIGNKESLQEYQDVIRQLLLGQYQAAKLDLKKCKGLRIYSVRAKGTERADRLLFGTIEKADGKRYLVLLEIIKNHDYQKSKILNGNKAALQAYFDNDDPHDFSDVITEDEFLDFAHVELDASSDEYQLKRIHYYQKRFLEFNDVQEHSLHSPLPLAVSGAPGSGKSCVATAALMQVANQLHQQGETGRVLYIAESPRLVNAIRETWSTLPKGYDRTQIAVNILSYDELLKRSLPELKDKKCFTEEDFNQWFNHYVAKMRKPTNAKRNGNKVKGKRHNKQHNSHGSLADNLASHKALVYQEFRIISGYTRERYLELGAKQSLFDTKKLKAFLATAYAEYLKFLAEQDAYCPHFINYEPQEKFKFIVVDEAQDFSLQQLSLLTQQVENFSICFALDTHQSLHDSQSIRPFLRELFYSFDVELTNVHLPSTYRCPPVVMTIANAILNIKHTVTGGTSDKFELNQIDTSELVEGLPAGKCIWYDKAPENEESPFPHLAATRAFAVVTWPEFYDEASERFDTPLIFTPDHIKGLEYPHILLYRIFDRPIFKTINQQINGVDIAASQHVNRPKNTDINHIYFRPILNSAFMSATRTMDTLYWVQEKNHDNEHIVSYIQNAIAKKPQPVEQVVVEAETPAAVDWPAELARLVANASFVQAKRIYEKYLSEFRAEFLQIADSQPAFKEYLTSNQQSQTVKKRATSKKKSDKKPSIDPTAYLKDNIPVRRLKEPKGKVKKELYTIWNDFKEENIVRLLKKPELLFEYLMESPQLPDYAGSMLTLITLEKQPVEVSGPARFELLVQVIKKNPELITPLFGEYLFCYRTYYLDGKLCDESIITNLSAPDSTILLHELIKANPAILNKMSFKLLLKHRNENVPLPRTLSLLFLTDNGISVFFEIIKHKPSWIPYLNRDLLVSDFNFPSEPELKKYSLLFMLSKRSQGRDLIFYLDKMNPNFMSSFKHTDLWNLARTSGLQSETEYNPLLGMAISDEPANSLLRILETKLPGVITDMPFAILTKRMAVQDMNASRSSILDSLLLHQIIHKHKDQPDKVNQISQLAEDCFTKHPEYFTQLSGEYLSDFFVSSSYYRKKLAISSISVWLSSTLGRSLFAKAVEMNPAILTGLDANVMFYTHPDDSTIFAQLSPVAMLSLHQENLPLLSKYIDTLTTEQILQYFTLDFLTQELHFPNRVMLLHCLMSSAEGLAILQKLNAVNPALLTQASYKAQPQKTITEQPTVELMPMNPSVKAKLNALLSVFSPNNIKTYFTWGKAESILVNQKFNDTNFLVETILSDPEGRLLKLMNVARQNPAIAKQPYWSKALTTVWENQDKAYSGTNGLQILTQHEYGMDFLKLLIDTNTDILTSITLDSLVVNAPHPHCKGLNLTPLFFLTLSPQGIKILDAIITHNPFVLDGLTLDMLTQKAQNAPFLEGLFPFFNLCYDADSHYVLLKILKARPDILEDIDLDIFLSTQTIVDEEDFVTVALVAKFVKFYQQGITELVDYITTHSERFRSFFPAYMNNAGRTPVNTASSFFRPNNSPEQSFNALARENTKLS